MSTRFRSNAWLWILGGLLIGIALGSAAWLSFGPGKAWLASGGSKSQEPVVKKMSDPAPDFELTDLDGNPVRLSDLRGKVVALNFWATWCGPCKLEMPLLEEAASKNRDDLTVLAINFEESPETVRAFVDELALHLPVVIDKDGAVNRQFKVYGFPTTMFIDRDGYIRYQHIGILNRGSLNGYLEKLGIEQ